MANTDPTVTEMPVDPGPGTMPTYRLLLEWLDAEITGLDTAQLDFDDDHPDREWMWWSIRRQVSHIAWDSLVFTHRRCASLLWPDGNDPEQAMQFAQDEVTVEEGTGHQRLLLERGRSTHWPGAGVPGTACQGVQHNYSHGSRARKDPRPGVAPGRA